MRRILFKFVLTRRIDLVNSTPFSVGGNWEVFGLHFGGIFGLQFGGIFGRGQKADVKEEKHTTGESNWVKHPESSSPTGACNYFLAFV